MYNPKPAKYNKGNALCLANDFSWDVTKNLLSIFSDVSKNLLYHFTGTPYEDKYLPGCSQEMKEDPYLIWHMITDMDYSFQSTDRSTFKNFIAKTGRKAGLWTLHGKSGSNLGVAGDTFLIRINPEAWESILEVFCQTSYALDLISFSQPNPDNPGWRKIPWHMVKEDKSIGLYKRVQSGTIQIKKGNDKYFLMKDMTESNDVLIRDYMEHLIQMYQLTELKGYGESSEVIKALFPNTPSILVSEGYMRYDTQKRLEEELKIQEKKLANEIKEVREKRKISRAFRKLGGWDGLLTLMGKDLRDSLAFNAVDWARGEREKGMSFRVVEDITKMARDYLEGTIEFPKED
jgi:hypothetical protein